LTYYSAEIINTLTNLLFLYLSYKGLKSCRINGHDTVFSVAYFGYFLVGIGSFMFHTTLKYPWQLVDELNMIYTTCLMMYASLSYSRPTMYQAMLGVFLTLFCGFITLYYHYLQDPTFHQNVYAALTVFIVFRSLWTMEVTLRPSLRKTREKDRLENDRDSAILKQMWQFVAFGLSVFLGGFAIWGLDNVYCSSLRRWRRQIGMPWGFFLEGHGWWHLMTGLGAYCYIVWGIHLRRVLNGQQDEFEMIWPNFWTLPEIVKIPETRQCKVKANGAGLNGKIQ
jgi:dihydroceramidase